MSPQNMGITCDITVILIYESMFYDIGTVMESHNGTFLRLCPIKWYINFLTIGQSIVILLLTDNNSSFKFEF